MTAGTPDRGHVSFLSDGKFYRTHLARPESPAVEINASLAVVVKTSLDEINIGIGRFCVKKIVRPCESGRHLVRLKLYGHTGPAPASDLTIDFRLKTASAASSEPLCTFSRE